MSPNRRKPRRRGRPTKAEVAARAADGVDPDTVDPRRVLAGVCVDPGSPATAKVAAAKALLMIDSDDDGAPRQAISAAAIARRTFELLKKGNR